jgi:hypothetical protein
MLGAESMQLAVRFSGCLSKDFEANDSEASLHFKSSVGVTYPISEHWEFRATAYAGSDFGRNDSPLFIKNKRFLYRY